MLPFAEIVGLIDNIAVTAKVLYKTSCIYRLF